MARHTQQSCLSASDVCIKKQSLYTYTIYGKVAMMTYVWLLGASNLSPAPFSPPPEYCLSAN